MNDNSEEPEPLVYIPPQLAAMLRASLGWTIEEGDSEEEEAGGDDDGDDGADEEGWETATADTSTEEDAVEEHAASTSMGDNGMPSMEDVEMSSKISSGTNVFHILRQRELAVMHKATERIYRHFIPSGKPQVRQRFTAKTYCGQYSHDGSMFYSATQDFKIHLYNCLDGFKKVETINAMPGNWTMTDCDLSRNNRDLIYSSISETVYMVNLDPHSETHLQHTPLYFSDGRGEFGIWSIRLSNDGKEVIAGSNGGQIFVYDIERQKHLHRIRGHVDDVNAVCFADDSSNVVISGSDDCFLKIWDRRSLRKDSKPSGVLVGHTEGVTFVASKRDGRSLISNGKDQRMMMWDLRKILNPEPASDVMRRSYSRKFDYRWEAYPGQPRKHPHDVSVKSFTGHKVLRTLIRCHFSPESTGHRFVYTGSSDGRIFIFDTEAESGAEPTSVMEPPKFRNAMLNGPSMLESFLYRRMPSGACTRDVSWHPGMPTIGEDCFSARFHFLTIPSPPLLLTPVSSTWLNESGSLLEYSFTKKPKNKK
ncbi:hypothetical protein HDU67_008490 [Dinochytrium kinnereticum]|nr:hypothetical protein HDU67_008490 [Dinochytrium kinnereticum]